MRTLVITILLALFAVPAAAETTHNDIRGLIAQVAEASQNPGTDADLDVAAQALQQALVALRRDKPAEGSNAPSHGPHGRRGRHGYVRDRERCIDIGFAAYNKAFDERYAFEQATKKCRGELDADLLELSFAVHAKVFDDRYAFDQALEFSRREDLQGKIGLVQMGFDAYRKVFDGRAALDMAAKWAAPLRRRDEGCIRRAKMIHAKTFDERYALEQAAKTCAE